MTARTVGVEEEFLLVRAGLDGLAAEGENVVALADVPDPLAGGTVGDPFEHEFKAEQAELGSQPCLTLDDLGEQLHDLRQRLASATEQRGAVLVASGTSPLPGSATATPDARYERMDQEFEATARQQLSCGMHVHVAVDGSAEGVAVLDRIRPWLAVLTALSANSPFWQGEDTGYASYRTQVWGQWPTAGPMEAFGDVAGYERATADLIATGAALDDGMIYFDARLSASYPTVEIRVADVCALVEDAVLIAALARGLVAAAARRWREGYRMPAVRTDLLLAARWRAARYGMSGTLVDVTGVALVPAWELVDRLVGFIRAELVDTGDLEVVRTGVAALRQRGTGADRQRRTLAASGQLSDVLRTVTLPSRAR